MSIEIRQLSKTFPNGFRAVDAVSFKMETGSLVAVLGPSGSGKSTLLRMIAGLEVPDAGDIILTGKEATLLSARDRNVGFVFQHYALFKHMNVWENIAFGLKMRKAGKQEIQARVSELVKLVQLEGMEKRYPTQLSGGQRQRVAVARALAPQPQVLLLDEPFGALDAKVRVELQEWITELHEKSHVTTLFVTHDQDEAMAIASDILVMNKGKIEQEGTPLEIYDHPRTEFVAQFVGEANYVDAKVVEPELAIWGPFKYSVSGYAVGQRVRIYFRPNDVYVTSREESLQVKGKIIKTRFQGPVIELLIDVNAEKPVVAHLPKGLSIASGFVEGREVFVGVTGFHSFAI
jgi:sulfate/thiosulfate transport system ATP-binding protein